MNFFRRFLPAAALMLKPLTDALRSTAGAWSWTPSMQSAFEASRAALTKAATLRHPRPGSPVALAVDASAQHIGAVLQQLEGSTWAPLAFYSRKLSEAEQKYSTFDRELLAAYAAVRHFHFFLEGREFSLLTDHKPLTAAPLHLSQPANSGICHIWRSLPPTSVIFLVLQTRWLMLFLALLRHRFQSPPLPQPLLRHLWIHWCSPPPNKLVQNAPPSPVIPSSELRP